MRRQQTRFGGAAAVEGLNTALCFQKDIFYNRDIEQISLVMYMYVWRLHQLSDC